MNSVNESWERAVKENDKQTIVLDDDPTGIQTMSNIAVYTSWSKGLPKKITGEKANVVFVWTNSRALSADDAKSLYRSIAKDLIDYYKKTGIEFKIISRSDSTLRGNYPEETRAFYDIWKTTLPIDAELIIPCFFDGGRVTVDDIHYLIQDGKLVPCADTEFAKDKTFGYTSHDMKEWVAEKHGWGLIERVTSITLRELRSANTQSAYKKLTDAQNFEKIIINAVEMDDLKVLAALLSKAIKSGKRYIFRTAASFVNAASGVMPKKACIHLGDSKNGLFIAGSHTGLTTAQIKSLIKSGAIGLELDVTHVFNRRAMDRKIRSLRKRAVQLLKQNKSVCIYTPREYHEFKGKTNLEIAIAISDALVNVVRKVYRFADYIVAKGGITSHEIAVKALNIKKATVLGQAIPGVPVVAVKKMCKKQLNYTIFPGNVGGINSLVKIKQIYEGGNDYDVGKS